MHLFPLPLQHAHIHTHARTLSLLSMAPWSSMKEKVWGCGQEHAHTHTYTHTRTHGHAMLSWLQHTLFLQIMCLAHCDSLRWANWVSRTKNCFWTNAHTVTFEIQFWFFFFFCLEFFSGQNYNIYTVSNEIFSPCLCLLDHSESGGFSCKSIIFLTHTTLRKIYRFTATLHMYWVLISIQ